jgi:acyl carrier protein
MDYENNILNILSNFLEKKTKEPANLNLETEFANIDIDSLDVIEISFLIEETLGLSFNIEDLININLIKISDLVDFIKDHAKTSK